MGEYEESKMEVKEITKEINFEDFYKPPKLPKRIRKEYEFRTCLSYSKKSRVYLVSSIEDGTVYVLKYGKGRRAKLLQNEYEIMQGKTADFLPRVKDVFVEKNGTYLLREYVKGVTLASRVEEEGPYELPEALSLMEKICDCIAAFHEDSPPLLHRDIKPENIVLREDGQIVFIDLDTVRKYDEDKTGDTIYVGSKKTAAPEQFGYKQTSVRTDIYGLGVLFLFLLTGQYTVYASGWASLPVSVKRTINRCLSFDPARRYPSARSLSAELKSIGFFHLRRSTVALFAACLVAVLSLGGVLVNRAVENYRYENMSVAFQNPVIEEAVRDALDKDAKDIITPEELSGITTLCICGDNFFASWQEHIDYHSDHWAEFNETDEVTEAVDLADLSYMPNLRRLSLDNCGLTGESLEVLKDLPLDRLSVQRNQIEDAYALSGMENLRVLFLDQNPLSSVEPLASCPRLAEVHMQNTNVSDLSPLSNLALTYLDVIGSPVSDFRTAFGEKTNLDSFYATECSKEEVDALSNMTHLRLLGIFETPTVDESVVSKLSNLESVDFTGSKGIQSVEWAADVPRLDYLGLSRTSVKDISPLTKCEMLTHLDLNGTPVKDLKPLKKISYLQILYIDSGKEAAVNALHLPDTVEVIVVD